MKNKLVFCFLVYLVCLSGASQNMPMIFPSSPNASELMKYVNLPVSLDTGIPTINYELMSIKGVNGEVPITLSYHASGIKVNEVPSWVGSGWSLNAGGVITRTVVGLADESENGFIGLNLKGKLVNGPLTAQYLRNVSNNIVDSQPDIFYFNFLNFHGKFTFDADGNVVMLPHQDFKIIPAIGPKKADAFWTIIDTEGNKYKFGVLASSIETMQVSITKDVGGNITTGSLPSFISGWYLCEIESATGDKIFFKYKNGNPISFDQKSKSASIKQFPGYASQVNVKFVTNSNKTTNPVYLDEITTSSGYIKFNSPSLRNDLLNGFKLDNIQLFNNKSVLLKKLNFDYDYFVSSDCILNECKRLKLNGVSLEAGGNLISLYEFQYNQNFNLPSRYSPQIDHWGYYNLNNETILNYGNETNRAPNLNGTKANVLEKIFYSTGGSVEFEFELNEFNDNNVNSFRGGLRVSKIIENYNYGSPVEKNFVYKIGESTISSGTSYLLPLYVSNGVCISDDNTHNWSVTNLVSHSLRALYDLDGSSVKYKEVKIDNSDKSSETNFFTNFTSNPDIRNQYDYRRYVMNFDTLSFSHYINPFEAPFSPPSLSNFNERSFLTKKIYKNALGQTVFTLENIYEKINPVIQYLSKGLCVSQFATNSYGTQQVFSIGNYAFKNDIYVLKTTKETKYDLNNILAGVEIIKDYKYSPEFPTLKTEEIFTDSDNKKNKTIYQYTFDLVNTENYMINLKERNYIGKPVIEKEYVDETEVSQKINSFDYSSGYYNNGFIPLIKEIKEVKAGLQKSSLLFEKYDSNGNILQFSKDGMVHTSVIWGYSKNQPIAKIENVEYTNISPSLITNAQTASDSGIENDLLAALTTLRNSLPNAMFTTYTYKPLVGISSITDAKGDTSYFEYDEFNRLKVIKDAQGNILTENQYHYKN